MSNKFVEQDPSYFIDEKEYEKMACYLEKWLLKNGFLRPFKLFYKEKIKTLKPRCTEIYVEIIIEYINLLGVKLLEVLKNYETMTIITADTYGGGHKIFPC